MWFFLRAAMLACTLMAVSCLTILVSHPQVAWADEGYSVTITTASVPETLEEGDEFSVSEVLSKDGANKFTMYALSSAVTYDSAILELVSCSAPTLGVATIQNGVGVYNALAAVFAGEVLDSPLTLCDLTFRVIGTGEAYVGFDYASVSTYSGMASYPVTATGCVISINSSSVVTPTEPEIKSDSESLEPSDEGRDSEQSFADNVRKDPTTAYDETLKAADVERLEKAGFTDEELVSLGFTQDELQRARDGEEVTPALSASSQNGSGGDAKAEATTLAAGAANASTQASSGFPWVAVVIAVVVVVGVAVAVVVVKRRKQSRG